MWRRFLSISMTQKAVPWTCMRDRPSELTISEINKTDRFCFLFGRSGEASLVLPGVLTVEDQ
jgi:hypothetical protein